MNALETFVATVITCELCGCATVHNAFGPTVSAEPLAIPSIPTENFDKREYLASIVVNSYNKCNSFISTIVKQQTNVNAFGDILAGTLSGLATIFTPLATVHALTGASTIVTGSKSALDSDFWDKASAANFGQAINATYYTNMGQYSLNLPNQDVANLIVNNEIAHITAIHSQCALAPAETAIQAALTPPGSAQNPNPGFSQGGHLPPLAPLVGKLPTEANAPNANLDMLIPGRLPWRQ